MGNLLASDGWRDIDPGSTRRRQRQPKNDGLQPKSDGLQPKSDDLEPKSDGLEPNSGGLEPKSDGLQPSTVASNLLIAMASNLECIE